MSRYMQIDIRILPFYERRFVDRFPNIAELLQRADYSGPLKEEVSLYRLVDFLEGMSRDPKVNSALKEKIRPYVQRVLDLKSLARDHLLSRRLNELDQVLYRIEDQFEDLEESL